MAKFLYWFITILILFVIPSSVFAISPTITVTFPETVEIGKENEVEVTVNNTIDSYNLKIYGSPVNIKRTKNYAETFNLNKYAGVLWSTYPIVIGQVPTKIKFRIKPITEDQDYIYLSAGINKSSGNVYSDWVKVNVVEVEENIIEDEGVDETESDPPILKLELPDNIIFNQVLDAKIRIQNSDDKYLIKVLGSQDKKTYGFIKTLNDEKLLNWNSSWDTFPTVQNKGLVNFIIDNNIENLFIKLRGKNLSKGSYLESDWYEVEVEQPEIQELKGEVLAETDEKVEDLPKNDKIRIDYSKIPYKKVAFNVYDDEKDVKPTIINSEVAQIDVEEVKTKEFNFRNLINIIWQRVMGALAIQKK